MVVDGASTTYSPSPEVVTFDPLGHTHGGYEPANANIQAHVVSAHAPSNAQKNSDITKAEIEAKLTGQIASHTHAGGSEAFPVGAVFIAVVATNPAILLGYGVWLAFVAGRVLVGLDALDTDFDTVEETGGAKTVTLTEAQIPAHTHLQNAHSHTYASQTATTGAVSSYEHGAIDTSSAAAESTISVNAATAVNQNAGGGQAHSNLPPYIVAYFWKRTA